MPAQPHDLVTVTDDVPATVEGENRFRLAALIARAETRLAAEAALADTRAAA